MLSYDIGGGGPVGATAARVAADHGVEVLLVEEHPQVGRPSPLHWSPQPPRPHRGWGELQGHPAGGPRGIRPCP
ncbi:MAG: NAD(P)-binding protein [Candidatus Bipolaricaulia bacterium]